MSLNRQHLPSLDGLRGLAVLMVITHNVQGFDPAPAGAVNQLAMYLFDFGWMGVQLFFVLSGFLITGILLDTRDDPHRWRNFAMRRVLRIFPLYYGALLLIFGILPLLGWQPAIYQADAPYQIWHWLYLSNWAAALHWMPESHLPHLWSLAVEEQFYLLWPLVLWWCRKPGQVLVASLVLAVVSLLSRIWLLRSGADSSVVYELTPCRMDALTLGAFAAALLRIPACAIWLRQRRAWWLSAALLLAGSGFVVTHGFPRNSFIGQTLGYTILAILFGAVILFLTLGDLEGGRWPNNPLRSQPLSSVGRYSYGMYVIHKPLHDLFSAPVLAWLGIHTSGSIFWTAIHVVLTMVASYLAAFLSYQLFEVHFLKLKRHFA